MKMAYHGVKEEAQVQLRGSHDASHLSSESRKSSRTRCGTLVVEVLSCKDLRKKLHIRNTSNPFCRISFEDEVCTTQIIHGKTSLNFEGEEIFTFDVTDVTETVKISVLSYMPSVLGIKRKAAL